MYVTRTGTETAIEKGTGIGTETGTETGRENPAMTRAVAAVRGGGTATANMTGTGDVVKTILAIENGIGMRETPHGLGAMIGSRMSGMSGIGLLVTILVITTERGTGE